MPLRGLTMREAEKFGLEETPLNDTPYECVGLTNTQNTFTNKLVIINVLFSLGNTRLSVQKESEHNVYSNGWYEIKKIDFYTKLVVHLLA